VDPDTDPDPAFQVNPGFPDPIRIQGVDDQKLKKKNTDENFFDQKLQFTRVQARGEAFSLQKRISSTSKKRRFINFFYVCE
jgi:hypothetical protein